MQDKNYPTVEEEKAATIREKIEKLNALLSEALVIEARINGGETVIENATESDDPVLGFIEHELDRVFSKADAIVAQLHQIEGIRCKKLHRLHKIRHEKLHQALDELAADYISHTHKSLGRTTVIELIEWSHKQTISPSPDEGMRDEYC